MSSAGSTTTTTVDSTVVENDDAGANVGGATTIAPPVSGTRGNKGSQGGSESLGTMLSPGTPITTPSAPTASVTQGSITASTEHGTFKTAQKGTLPGQHTTTAHPNSARLPPSQVAKGSTGVVLLTVVSEWLVDVVESGNCIQLLCILSFAVEVLFVGFVAGGGN